MGAMTTMLHAPGRRDTRAIAIAKVKFVMLPTAGEAERAAVAVAPVQTEAPSIFSALRAFFRRVIGRLEAARP